jgi:translation initiation factor 1
MDPFAFAQEDPFGVGDGNLEIQKENIHVRFYPGKRAITMIEGLDDDLDQKRIARAMKRAFNCATSLHKDKVGRDVIKLQGDQVVNVRDWLLAQEILTKKEADQRLVLHRA